MKCHSCNSVLKPKSKFCPNCGLKVEDNNIVSEPKEKTNITSNDDGAIGWGILGFFIPIAGIILFIVWLHEKPKSSKASLIGALIRIGIVVLVLIFIVTIYFINTYRYSYIGNTNDYNYNNIYDYDDYYDYDDFYDYDDYYDYSDEFGL